MNRLPWYTFFALCCSFSSCLTEADPQQDNYWSTHVPFRVSYNTFSMPVTEKWIPLPENLGAVPLSEASGLAYSYQNPGKIWTHQDSGNTNILFLLDSETAEIVAKYRIEGTVNIDWEDIEVSFGPEENITYLYISDTGDNNLRRNQYTVYRIKEPVFEEAHRGQTITLSNLELDQIDFDYPDGSHDAEGLMVDPETLDIFLTTKRSTFSKLYVLPYPQENGVRNEAVFAGEFGFRDSSAATTNLQGDKVLIKNRQEIFFWERQMGETMVEMLARTPLRAPYIGEPQGEAICLDPNNNYFTLSEELNSSTPPNLYKYLLSN